MWDPQNMFGLEFFSFECIFNSDAFYVDNPIYETSGSGTEYIFVKPPELVVLWVLKNPSRICSDGNTLCVYKASVK